MTTLILQSTIYRLFCVTELSILWYTTVYNIYQGSRRLIIVTRTILKINFHFSGSPLVSHWFLSGWIFSFSHKLYISCFRLREWLAPFFSRTKLKCNNKSCKTRIDHLNFISPTWIYFWNNIRSAWLRQLIFIFFLSVVIRECWLQWQYFL